ncbi:lethal(2) giant larvae protein homolog 1 isoform X2 [Schistocerca serialis cubense]|uniref:lethal(2) giant larvae protein homolog 1 isoform X2 n=1 Tax=Schistocerca serialis cubense TaxID=2023355 RepID=UPI00214F0716|nr:lethal(2) giant larvae protein homolog 1 isoform X2 [Schistocerca serialis cubense]
MLKFIRGKGQQPSAERQKLQRELFAFRKTIQHGFPNKPTSLAWDPTLRLLALGTASGAIKVFGKPGVEFYGQHTNHEAAVTRLVFIPNEGRIVSLCDDNSLHMWEINEGSLEEVKAQALEGKLKRISAIALETAGEHLLLGTEGGNIYLLNLKTFQMSDTIIYQDIVMQNVPEDYKINPGAVEAIAEQPGNPDKILIGYNRGLMVLWNRKTPGAEQNFISNQQLESICWHKSGTRFASSHNDGSYAMWDISVGDKAEDPVTVYGPFPCKAVTKFLWRRGRNEDYIIFAGGMPRASYSDRHTVTVQHGEKHVVFDFTSKVIDFFTIAADEEDTEYDEPETLIVLLEEELVAIDLLSEDWRMLQLPYLVSLHASAVTCAQHISNVPEDLWEAIVAAGKQQTLEHYSEREWPVDGGRVLQSQGSEETSSTEFNKELLLTGHEDGTVRFWNAGHVALQPLYKFASAQLFSSEEIGSEANNGTVDEEEEEEWPPFRKVGTFDPYSDDPRLAVKKVALCPFSGTLAVAGTAGAVIVAKIGSDTLETEVNVTTTNIVLDRDGFVWKGHDQLTARTGALSLAPGFQPCSVLQLHPPAAVTALVLQADWGLVAAGTAHGLALFDYIRHKGVLTKCTLNPNDLSGAGDAPISRRKSFKKSLRESFRRLRKGRSTRRTDKRGVASPVPKKDGGAEASTPSSAPLSPVEAKPVERQVEARPVDDSLGSMVRCLYFAKTFIISVQSVTATLWAGTNNGTVYVFTIAVPVGQRRTEEDVTCQLGKEIQLKHRAPVISVAVLDGINVPLPEPFEIEKGLKKLPDTSGPHRVVICSEEQFKIFTLPSLKPFCKFKLTAHEGSRVRRMSLAHFVTSRPDRGAQYSEWCIVVSLTNLGDCIVLSVPDLRRQLNAAVVRREDINGISSLTFTRYGEAFYLHSSSELQRITLSASTLLYPRCRIDLPEGARQIPKEEETEEEEMEVAEEEEAENASPSAAARDHPPASHTVNGDATHEENKDVEPKSEDGEEAKENGAEEDRNDISALSVGDITIDSVKDHLLTSTATEDGRVTELKTERLELNSRTTEMQSVVMKTTIISSSETTVINSADIAVVEPSLADEQRATNTLEIKSRKAPLARMEDLEVEIPVQS